MLEALLYAALACGAISALAGSRTAWVLLASAAYCLLLDYLDVPFNPVLWMLFDFVVVVLIVRPKMSHADCAVLALFMPAWVAYQMPDPQRYSITALVAIAQFMFTVSPKQISSAPARYRAWWRGKDRFNQLVAHVRLAGAYA